MSKNKLGTLNFTNEKMESNCSDVQESTGISLKRYTNTGRNITRKNRHISNWIAKLCMLNKEQLTITDVNLTSKNCVQYETSVMHNFIKFQKGMGSDAYITSLLISSLVSYGKCFAYYVQKVNYRNYGKKDFILHHLKITAPTTWS